MSVVRNSAFTVPSSDFVLRDVTSSVDNGTASDVRRAFGSVVISSHEETPCAVHSQTYACVGGFTAVREDAFEERG